MENLKKNLKILHTSDWHLGKKLFKEDRLQEHDFFLSWLIETIKSEAIDQLWVAGDIYDTPSPPSYACRQFFDFCQRLSDETNCSAVFIAGNHDSGKFLEAPQSILQNRRIQIIGRLSPSPLEHFYQNECFQLAAIPYFRTYELLNYALKKGHKADVAQKDILKIFQEYLEEMVAPQEKATPTFVIFHHSVGEFLSEGVEQSIALSGLDAIPVSCFENICDYLLLGHIHKYQIIKHEKPHIVYSGSPLAMRFSESNEKFINKIEIINGVTTIEKVKIPNARPLIKLKTTPEDWQEDLEKELTHLSSNLMPWLEVEMKLQEPIYGLADQIRERAEQAKVKLLSYYPLLERMETKDKDEQQILQKVPSTQKLFELFYQKKYPESQNIPSEVMQEFLKLLERATDELREAERSGGEE